MKATPTRLVLPDDYSVREKLLAAFESEPSLTEYGNGPYHYSDRILTRMGWDAERAKLSSESSLSVVEWVYGWLRATFEPTDRISGNAGSYRLKHAAENCRGGYVSNGQLILAAIAAGYLYSVEPGAVSYLFGMPAIAARQARLESNHPDVRRVGCRRHQHLNYSGLARCLFKGEPGLHVHASDEYARINASFAIVDRYRWDGRAWTEVGLVASPETTDPGPVTSEREVVALTLNAFAHTAKVASR